VFKKLKDRSELGIGKPSIHKVNSNNDPDVLVFPVDIIPVSSGLSKDDKILKLIMYSSKGEDLSGISQEMINQALNCLKTRVIGERVQWWIDIDFDAESVDELKSILDIKKLLKL
jgi:hypothetical protein